MKLIKSDDIIILDCTYHQKDIAIFLGFKWDRDVKCWYSNNRNKNKRLSKLSDEDLIDIEKKFKENYDLSFASTSDIDIPKPDGLDYLPFQKAGIEFAIKNRQTLNASEMGLGKSIQAIGYMNYSQFKNVLVVTTASLKLNWQKEIEKWITYPIDIQILESSKKFKYNDGVLICNYDVLKKFSDQLERSQFDLIIADEVHYVKNKHAMRSFVFYKIVKNIPFKMYLSGTPVVDRPLELYDIIKSLGYTRTKSEYTSLYCPLVSNGFALIPGPATNLDLLQKELRSQFMYRVMKKDVLKELPDKFKQIIYIDDKKSLKAEQNAIKGFMNNTNLSNEEYNSFINSTTAFTPQFIGMIAQIRKETAINKLPFSISLIKETLESKDKVVVFAHHKEVVNGLYESFKNVAVKIDGGTKMEDRQLAVDKFQNDKSTKLFIGSILAAGTGITLTASNHVIFVEMDWTPSNMTQAEDRCHRIGQHDNVTVQYIVVNNSIDAMVAKKLIKKEKVFDEMFNR